MGSLKQRISYFPVEGMDAEMRKEMDRCQLPDRHSCLPSAIQRS